VDIHLNTTGPFIPYDVGGTLVFPGRYWSQNCSGSTWDKYAAAFNIPDSCMIVDPAKASSGFDPMVNRVLIGSGPWMCADRVTGIPGFGCSSSGTQQLIQGGTYTLTRYGKGQTPGATGTKEYFRSSGSLALYLWTLQIGDTAWDIIIQNDILPCFGPSQPPPTLGQTTGCGHYQQGIGQASGLGNITIIQFSIYARFKIIDWVQPFAWAQPPCQIGSGAHCTGQASPPDGMVTLFGATLYAGPYTLYAAASLRNGIPVGCNTAYNPTLPANSGGYDC
jgi:hypothetical protein